MENENQQDKNENKVDNRQQQFQGFSSFFPQQVNGSFLQFPPGINSANNIQPQSNKTSPTIKINGNKATFTDRLNLSPLKSDHHNQMYVNAIQQNIINNSAVPNPSQLHVLVPNFNISSENSSDSTPKEFTPAHSDSIMSANNERDNSLPEDSIEDFRLDAVIGNLVNFAKSHNGSR